MKYYYPAIFNKHVLDGEEAYTVNVPDFPHLSATENNIPSVYSAARSKLSAALCLIEDLGESIPTASDIFSFKVHHDHEFVSIIEVDTSLHRVLRDTDRVSTNVTLPSYLKELSTENKLNFSQTLEEALKAKLGIEDNPMIHVLRKYRQFTLQERKGRGYNATQNAHDLLTPEQIEVVELWKSLLVPFDLIRKELPNLMKGINGPFPFFLRLEEAYRIYCAISPDYPEEGILIIKATSPDMKHQPVRREKFTLTPESVQSKLNEGFVWCRVEEYDTLWTTK